jgi:hypothetical protein
MGRSKYDGPEIMAQGSSVSIFRLFAFADPLDYLLLTVGTVAAMAHGAAMPVFFLFFGDLIDAFGSNVDNPSNIAHSVNKVEISETAVSSALENFPTSDMYFAVLDGLQYALYLVYLGLVVWVASWGGKTF